MRASRRAQQWASPRAQRLALVARAAWKRYVGITEEVVEVDVNELLPAEELPARRSPPPLPPVYDPWRHDEGDAVPQHSGEFDRIGDICTPAVVQLARTSGRAASVNYFAARGETTYEILRRRSGR